MAETDKKIRKHFRVKHRDNLPYTGWLPSVREDIYDFMGKTGGFERGAEIGVRRGENAIKMFERIPNLHLICIDPWTGFSRSTTDEKAIQNYNICVKLLEKYSTEYKKMTSTEAAKEVPDGSLDFVYIDGLHDFDNVIMDIITWVPKVRKNGIIAGHDYCEFYQSGIIEAVRVYTFAHNIQDWYVTRFTEKTPSWFWVNK